MCGIISIFQGDVITPLKTEPMMKSLLTVGTLRGSDSTGVFYGGLTEVDVYKKPVAGYDFVELTRTKRIIDNSQDYCFFVGHNRAATKGAVNASNAHPFQHKHITGVHNGTLFSWKHLTKGSFQTDSEHIFKALSETDTPKDVIEELDGAFALLWHNAKTDTLHFIRNDERPYHFLKAAGSDILLGASEYGMLKWLMSRKSTEFKVESGFEPKPMIEYVFDVNSPTKVLTEIEHKEYVRTYYQGRNNYYQYQPPKEPYRGLEVEFSPTSFNPYSGSPNGLGKWEGVLTKAPKKLDITKLGKVEIHACHPTLLDLNKVYTGKINYSTTDSVAVLINTIEESSGLQDDETVYEECCGCNDLVPIEKITYINDTGLCPDCVQTYVGPSYSQGFNYDLDDEEHYYI